MIELKVVCKDSERKLTKDFLLYDPVTFQINDPVLKTYVDDSKNEFHGEPDDIYLNAKMIWK